MAGTTAGRLLRVGCEPLEVLSAVLPMNGPLYSDQLTLFGKRRVAGWTKGGLSVVEVHREIANEVIRANHYSRKVYAASTVHLGVEWEDRLVGVLQYGFAMNPGSAGSVVAGTESDEYLELNRMWVSDGMPRNTETAALALSMRYIRAVKPAVGWIQTFADERCGPLGVVYQASSFLYCGEHTASFWEIDGTLYHNSLMTRDPRLTPAAGYCQLHKDRAVERVWRQFRYIKFLRTRFRPRLLLDVLPYPKHEGQMPLVADTSGLRLSGSIGVGSQPTQTEE